MSNDLEVIRDTINKLSEMVRHREVMTPDVEIMIRNALNAVDNVQRQQG